MKNIKRKISLSLSKNRSTLAGESISEVEENGIDRDNATSASAYFRCLILSSWVVFIFKLLHMQFINKIPQINATSFYFDKIQ